MNPILISIGGFEIHWYSVLILVAIVVAGTFIIAESRRFGIPKNFITNMMFWTILFAIVGARIYYVLFNLDYYSNNVIEIVKIWEGGLAIHGGVIAGLIFTIFYTRRYNIKTLKMFDIMVVSLILGQAIGRWGNFMNSEAYGPITNLETLKNLHIPQFIIDGMYINGAYYHPTFFYESLWCFIGFIILLVVGKLNNKTGILFSTYLIWYGIGRFLIESLRQDSLFLGNIKVAQLVSLIYIIVGIITLIRLRKERK